MKLKTLVILFTALTTQLFSQQTIRDSVSYAMALQISETLKQGDILYNMDLNSFCEGIYDAQNNAGKLTSEECMAIITNHFQKGYIEMLEKNLATANDFLEKNRHNSGVQETISGLQYIIIEHGSGKKPNLQSEVEVHYRGIMLNGETFDSSYERNQTATFVLGQVIKGWGEGLQLIGEGGKIKLFIPPSLAYGENSPRGSNIEPNSLLIFDIELIKVTNPGDELFEPQAIIPPPSAN